MTIGYQADSLLSFDVSAVSLAISALIFANSAWVISLVLIVLPFGIRTAAFPLPHASNIAPLVLLVNSLLLVFRKVLYKKNQRITTSKQLIGDDMLELFLF